MINNAYGRRLVARFEAAARDYTLKGSQYPEDHPAIEREYEQAKAALIRHLDNLKFQLDIRKVPS